MSIKKGSKIVLIQDYYCIENQKKYEKGHKGTVFYVSHDDAIVHLDGYDDQGFKGCITKRSYGECHNIVPYLTVVPLTAIMECI